QAERHRGRDEMHLVPGLAEPQPQLRGEHAAPTHAAVEHHRDLHAVDSTTPKRPARHRQVRTADTAPPCQRHGLPEARQAVRAVLNRSRVRQASASATPRRRTQAKIRPAAETANRVWKPFQPGEEAAGDRFWKSSSRGPEMAPPRKPATPVTRE